MSSSLLLDALKHALSGSIGGSIAMCAVYPLDLIRSHQMVHRNSASMLATAKKLTAHQGLKALYAGLSPVLVALTCSNATYFFVYALLKALALRRRAVVTPALNTTLALLAGVFNVLLTSPLWVAATRIKLGSFAADAPPPPSMLACIRAIARNEGVHALWRGTVASLVLVCAPTVQFTVYDQAKAFLHAHHSSATFFALGAVSKFVSTMTTYPLQLIQTRMRQSKLSVRETVIALLREEGVLALYNGIESKLLQTMLMSAIHFVIYEWVATFVMRLGAEQRALMINR